MLDWRWVDNATHRPLYPQERDPVPTVQEAGWAPAPVWTGADSLDPIGIRSPDGPVRSESHLHVVPRLKMSKLYFYSHIRFEVVHRDKEAFIALGLPCHILSPHVKSGLM